MDELLREVRETNSLLRLAFADQITAALDALMGRPNVRAVVNLLAQGEVSTGQLIEACKARGIARSTLFEFLSTLERTGVVTRPKRGVIALNPVAAAFLEAVRTSTDRRLPPANQEPGTEIGLFGDDRDVTSG